MGDFMSLGDKAIVEDMLSSKELHETAHMHGQVSTALHGTALHCTARHCTAAHSPPQPASIWYRRLCVPLCIPMCTSVRSILTRVVQHWGIGGAYSSVPSALVLVVLVRCVLTAIDIALPIPNGVYMVLRRPRLLRDLHTLSRICTTCGVSPSWAGWAECGVMGVV